MAGSEQEDQSISLPAATPFDEAAARLTSTMEDGHEVASADYETVVTALARYARGFGLSSHDAEEVVADVMSEMLARVRGQRGTESELRQPTAYLFWTTRNRARDRLRRIRARGETELVGHDADVRYYSDEDDAVVRLLDREATAAILEDALRAAVAAGDRLVVRVVVSWLNLAEETGAPPSSRAVAEQAELSHTSVNAALRRLATYLPPGAADAVSR